MLIELNTGQIRDCIACLGFVAHDLENSSIAEVQHRRRAQGYRLLAFYLQQQMNKEGAK